MKRLLPLALLLCALYSQAATYPLFPKAIHPAIMPSTAVEKLWLATWFVRVDGGTLWNGSAGQCDGHGDAAYPGSGTNQHCAVSNTGYLNPQEASWVIAGGDRVVIRGSSPLPGEQNPTTGPSRFGPIDETGAGCSGCGDPAPIPSGSSGAHTIIEGGCAYDGNCNPVNVYPYTSNLAQLFGGFSTPYILSVKGSSYVDLIGLELTTHNGGCNHYGTPAWPVACSSSPPLSDYGNTAIVTSNTTSHITMTDLYIDGFVASGIQGPIGGPINMTRVIVAFNAFAGWNMSDDADTPNGAGSSITAVQVWMEGIGCLEEYPIVHTTFPAKRCDDTNNGGFGDPWSGQDSLMDAFSCDQCTTIYNTKDGFLGPHDLIKNLSITRSMVAGNMGSQLKWGTQASGSTVIQNNFVASNCSAMSQQLPGAAQNFNITTGLPGSYLSGFCRAAGSPFAFAFSGSSTWEASGNTIVANANTIWQMSCVTAGTCSTTNLVMKNNAYLGYTAPSGYLDYGSAVPATYFLNEASPPSDAHVFATNQLFYGTRHDECSDGYGGITLVATGQICSDPQFVGEPAQGGWPPESALYGFNFHPATGSPLIHAGTTPCPSVDYYGIAQTSPCTIGAAVEAGTPPTGGGININVIMSGGIVQ